MTHPEFNEIFQQVISELSPLRLEKSEEYANEDILYNFKDSAKIGDEDIKSAWWGMQIKHYQSIKAYTKDGKNLPIEKIVSKIRDEIMYLILLEAIIKETP